MEKTLIGKIEKNLNNSEFWTNRERRENRETKFWRNRVYS
jgi:hypothetical protein